MAWMNYSLNHRFKNINGLHVFPSTLKVIGTGQPKWKYPLFGCLQCLCLWWPQNLSVASKAALHFLHEWGVCFWSVHTTCISHNALRISSSLPATPSAREVIEPRWRMWRWFTELCSSECLQKCSFVSNNMWWFGASHVDSMKKIEQ